MDTKEVRGIAMAGDPRIYHTMMERRERDKSFMEKGFLGFTPTYSQSEVREIYFSAIQSGMREGLMMGSLEGQRIDTSTGCKNERHKEFYQKFLKLAEEYNCAIVFDMFEGMCVMDLSR
jgi:hypothetical protein